MALSNLQSVVLYTTILITLKFIISHEIDRQGYSDDPVWQNFTRTMETAIALNGTGLQNSTITIANGTITNGTLIINGTSSAFNSILPGKKPFYLGDLPTSVFVYALLVPLQYYWNIGLERFFPARPRGVEVSHQREKKEKSFDDNEDRDEEVVKRWIAQGRVRRSSVSWCNTSFKWILDLTVGKLLYEIVFHLVEGIVLWEGLTVTLAKLKLNVVMCWLRSVFSIGPVASLIGFIVIPAHQRVVFRAGVDLVEAVFFTLFLHLVVPWAVKSEYMQLVMGNITESLIKNAQEASATVRTIDEL